MMNAKVLWFGWTPGGGLPGHSAEYVAHSVDRTLYTFLNEALYPAPASA
jgi:hypothetical protein